MRIEGNTIVGVETNSKLNILETDKIIDAKDKIIIKGYYSLGYLKEFLSFLDDSTGSWSVIGAVSLKAKLAKFIDFALSENGQIMK